jgi:hypothetical protein
MGTSLRDHRTAILVAVALLVVAGGLVASAAYLDNSVEVSGDIPLNASSGPEATFTGLSSEDANLSAPFPDANTVRWQSTAGNITISASSQVSLDVDSIEGSTTDVSSLNGASTEITLNPDDKQAVRVAGADSLSFTAMQLDDSTKDFTISSSQTATVNVTGFSSGQSIVAKDANGNILDGGTADGSGEVSFEIGMGGFDVFLQSASGDSPSLSDPQPEGQVDNFPSSVSINASDTDFPDDEVNVTFEVDGSPAGSDIRTSDGTASATINNPGIGTTTVTATAEDLYGNTNTQSWTFATPSNLTIRNVTAPYGIIDSEQVNATFFDDGEIIERSTTTGNISMEGIPGKENVIVSLEADGYSTVEALVIDFTEQTDAYMLETGATSRAVRFTLEDRTGGQWDDNGAVAMVQKPINQSTFDQPQWETVHADQFGPEGTTATLEDGQRYRIVLRNNDGDVKVVGTYSAEADETVALQVGTSTFKPEGDNAEWAYNATYDETKQGTFVRFEFNDSQDLTERIYIEMYEWRNESHVLVQNQSFGGPHGNFSFSEPVPGSDDNTTWVVEATIKRDGDTHKIVKPVGPNNPVLTGLPNRLKIIISIGTLLIVGGLFSQLNGHIGGLVIAGLGGIFYFVGFLPAATGIGVVVLAMIVAAVLFLREREVSGI